MKRHLLLAPLLPLPLLAALAALACTDTTAVAAGDVLTLTQCPADAGPCQLFADGQSQVTVESCLVPANAVADASATLQLSAGAWLAPTAPTAPTIFTAPLSPTMPCATQSFVTPTTPGPLQVEALFAGFTQTLDIPLLGAPIASVDITPSAALDAGADIGLTLTVATQTGTPSVGTTVTFTVSPAGAGTVYPTTAVLTGSSVTAQLLVAGSPASLTVTATATPPGDDPADAGVSGTISLGAPP